MRDDQPLELEPRALEVLAVLVQAPGHLQPRDALLDAVWGHRHVTPSTLNRVIGLLRQALGDAAGQPRYIETVPRRGYRFIAPVSADEGDEAPPESAEPATTASLFRAPPLPGRVEAILPREAELAELQDLLARSRLLTLLGPGGIGKTELALELARRSAGMFGDGTWVVDMGGCETEDDVVDALLSAFGLSRPLRGDAVQRLASSMPHKEILLLLDGCEPVADACAGVADVLLANCPDLRILATSQVRLGMEGEQVFRVPPFDLPPEDLMQAEDPVALARRSQAVRLLEMRALECDPGFTLDAGNVAAVAGLCRHLEGIPLALELAASRLRVLDPAQLLERLSGHGHELVADWHGGPPRQRTLRDTLDWSFNLLSPEEAELLSRLSIFVGGWTIEAAEAVAGWPGDTDADVVECLGGLLDKSFVAVDADAHPRRFRMLETVRSYVAERLGQDPLDATRLADRHLDYYLAFAARSGPVLYERPQHWFGQWLEREQGNLRHAFDFALAHAPAKALALAVHLRWYWWATGDFRQARDWLARSLDACPGTDRAQRARAQQFIGTIDLHLQEGARARLALRPAVEAGIASGLAREGGYALAALAAIESESGTAHAARRLLSDAMRVGVRARDPQVVAYARIWTSVMHAVGGKHRVALISSREAVGELEAFWSRLGAAPGFMLALARVNVGLASWNLGDLAEATRQFSTVIALGQGLRNPRICAAGLEGSGYVACMRGRYEFSARLLGSAQALRELTGVPMAPHWHAPRGQVLAVLGRVLAGRLGDLFHAGRAMSPGVLESELRYELAVAAEAPPLAATVEAAPPRLN